MTTKEALEKLLMSIPEYRAQTPSAGEVLNKTLLNDLARRYDKTLLDALYKDETLRSHFFTVLDGGGRREPPVTADSDGGIRECQAVIFKLDVFLSFINSYEFLPDSYTKYKQKIGLGFDAGYYLKQLGDVVLNFPYKDCVLKGGQTKDDEKRAEVFFNTVLAPDEVNRLLDDKAFTGWTRYTKDGEVPVGHLRADDNLIIKGNNLVVLHSLMRRYGGKVKLIYIDPPYNTGSDSFGYNDNFNHSSWLVFMKNRLETARQLLREDGCIFVQCDNSPNSMGEAPELGYLLVLCDEVFGRANYMTTLVWQKKGNASNTAEGIGTITETVIAYAKHKETVSLNMFEFDRKYDYKDEKGEYNLISPVKTNEGEYERKTMQFTIRTPQGDFNPPKGKRWTLGEDRINDIVKNNAYEIRNGVFKVKQYSFDYKNGNAKLYNNLLLDCGSLKSAKGELEALGFQRESFATPKPEALLARIIEIATRPGDIVLDYHLGSGTTAAVAHKMGRQYIGVEQMNYIKSVTVERLKKVIAGESGGVSKQAGWTGGGSFVYCEVASDAARYIERINKAEGEELDAIKDEIAASSCRNWRVDKDALRRPSALLERAGASEVLHEVLPGSPSSEAYRGAKPPLSAQEKRQILTDCLDPNDLYVHLSEIEDAAYEIRDEDKRLTREFYKIDSE